MKVSEACLGAPSRAQVLLLTVRQVNVLLQILDHASGSNVAVTHGLQTTQTQLSTNPVLAGGAEQGRLIP